MEESLRITGDFEFFDASDFEERAETYDRLHDDAAGSLRQQRATRAGVVLAVVGVVAATAYVSGSGDGAAVPPAEVGARQVAALPAPAAPAVRVAAAAAILDDADADEVLEAELSDSLLARLSQLSKEASEGHPPAVAPAAPAPRRATRRATDAAGAMPAAAPPQAKANGPLAWAVALHDAGRSQEAVPLLRGRPDGEALVLLGSIHQDLGELEAARAAYTRYLAAFPAGPHAGAIRGILARL